MSWDRLPATYDHVASVYEERFLDELDRKPRDRELLEAFSTAATDPVVEIGCGPGQIGDFVRRRDRRVFGLDLSVEMASHAATRLDGALLADMRQLPIASRSVGGLLAFYSIIHLRRPELPGALAELHRVLRPGGRVLFSAHEGEGTVELDEFLGEPVPFIVTLFELDELVDAARAVGLVVRGAERRAHYEGEITRRLYVRAERPLG